MIDIGIQASDFRGHNFMHIRAQEKQWRFYYTERHSGKNIKHCLVDFRMKEKSVYSVSGIRYVV